MTGVAGRLMLGGMEFPHTAPESYLPIAIALAIGLLFGFERGWRQREKPAGTRVAGIRTYALIGLFGGIAGLLGEAVSDAIVVAAFAAVAVFMIASQVVGVRLPRNRSITGGIVALIDFSLGVLAVRGDALLAAGVAVVCVALLNMRETIHALVRRTEKTELTAAIKLLLVSVVVLPLLPDRGYGPGEVLNPFALWWMVALLTTLSFAGYAAMRIAGQRHGLLLTGIFGGIASSTATTLTCAKMAKQAPQYATMAAAAIAAATVVSLLRTLILAGILSLATGLALAAPLLAGAATGIVSAFILFKSSRAGHTAAAIDLGPPADLGLAAKFALILAGFSLVVWYAREQLGDTAVIAASALSGLVDVDAVTVSMARLSGGPIAGNFGVTAILVAVAANTAIKAVYAGAVAGKVLLVPMALAMGAVLAALALGAAVAVF